VIIARTITTPTDPSITPATGRKAPPVTFVAAFQATLARVPDRVALRTPGSGVRLTWQQYGAAVKRTAGALASLGVRRGDRVAFLSRNRPELAICETAALHLGAAGVALYAASPPVTIEHVLRDSAPRALIVEKALAGALDEVKHAVPSVVALDGPDAVENLDSPRGFDFERAWQAVDAKDLLAILYTSGTTGAPKGVEWTHGAWLRALERFDMLQPEPDGIRDLSFAPFAHVGERATGHWRSMLHGSTRTFCATPAELPAALLDARPTFLFGSPRAWQGLKSALEATLEPAERACLKRAAARVRAVAGGAHLASLSDEDKTVLGTLRARIGLDRINRALTAAAPCPIAVQVHYHALGVPFGEFYAMTEFAACTMTRPGLADLGTVGRVIPGFEVRLDADGEVLVQSDSCARGYCNRPDATAETFGADGWVRSGDVGSFDEQGRLRIVDRKKELLIPAHGHNIAPSPIESELKSACALIGQAIVVGDRRPHLAALIVLEPAQRSVDAGAAAAVADAIKRVNIAGDPRERIEAHTILADAWTPGDELTQTLKLRRRRILQKYAAQIDAMYERPES
jgi:long-chain acyl-CoA synthetase